MPDAAVQPISGTTAALTSCPAPIGTHTHILLGHGSGGRLSADLLRDVILPGLSESAQSSAALEDQATVAFPGMTMGRLAFTTDAFVVRPLFFPGGDIGTLAVNGTVNDLAVGGATPLYLSASFIVEEGLAISDLRRIVASMRAAADAAGVRIVTGDTKVVDRGKGDAIFITTSGVGFVPDGVTLSIAAARPGDVLILSGTIGDHGVAIMSAREGLEFETVLQSDCAALNSLTRAMLDACPSIRCMRDATRGGVASAVCELAEASNVGVVLTESAIPVRPEVHGACEMLGLDPLMVANEGKLIAAVPRQHAADLLAAMRAHRLGADAAAIGELVADNPGRVVMKSVVGGQRVVSMLAGEQLPRIC